MARIFNEVRANKPRYNSFNLSHESKLSMNMGRLTPILCQEVVPGDRFRVNTEMLLRMSPLVAPVMHRVNVYTHFFFVPNRLVFKQWPDFITGGEDGESGVSFPVITLHDQDLTRYLGESSLADYLGIPVAYEPHGVIDINALPFRAYQLIYNEYYRDQNLQDSLEFSIGETVPEADKTVLLNIRNRCWEKDYFTSALPWTQKGGDVHLPLLGEAPLMSKGPASQTPYKTRDGSPMLPGVLGINTPGQGIPYGRMQNEFGQIIDPTLQGLYADMSQVTSATINELRRAVQLQKWLERNARGGSRYIESIFSHFGVVSSDARLQRPEYLGGGKSPVVISEVLQTSETNESPQGNMAGHGISVGTTHQFSKFFEEHGFIIGIMSVLPRTSYQQGLPRVFRKFNKFDYYWPEFAHLGEQEVYNGELYYDFHNSDPDDNPNDDTFGYQSRYSEYKFIPSTVHGEFRSSLAHWHMGRIFNQAPNLNASFVRSDPTTRVFAVEDEQYSKLYVQLYHDIRAIRPMPKFGTPSF